MRELFRHSEMSRPDEDIIELRNIQDGNYYPIQNIIQDHYRPFIGIYAVDVYGLYSRLAMRPRKDIPQRRWERVQIPRRIILTHLKIGKSTLTEVNLVLETCDLIAVQRANHRVNQIWLLNPCPITEEYRQTLLTRFEALTTSYPRLSRRVCTALQGWRSLDDLRRELFDDYVAARPSGKVAVAETTAACPPKSSLSSELPEWQDCLEQLRREMTQATYDNLLRGSTAQLEGKQLTIYVKSEQAKAWLEAKRMKQVQTVVDDYLESGLILVVEVD